jgi:protein-L-isoaspartate(D-aspartate) O-methyltransferase
MSEALQISPGMRVLEVGTGSGYQAAVLSALGARVHSIEIRPVLSAVAAETLQKVGAGDTTLHIGNGAEGIHELAPFDRVIVTAAPADVPPALTAQLRLGGCMLIPTGAREQQTLFKIKQTAAGLETTPMIPVLFVPMTPA